MKFLNVSLLLKILSYNEKISLAIISKEALKPNKVKSLAQDIALEIIRYDQQGCYSPQMIFIESSLKITPKMFAQMIECTTAVRTSIPSSYIIN